MKPAFRIVFSCWLLLGPVLPAMAASVSDTLFIGREALLRGRFEQSAQAFADVLAADPQNPYARTRLALALGSLGRLDAAGAELQKALAGRGDDLSALWTLGCLDLLAGRPADAAQRFAAMARVDPGSARGQAGLGLAAVQEGRTAEGVKLLGQVQEADSDDPLVHFLVGLAYWLLDAPANARLELEAALEYEPRNTAALELLGLVYRRQGKANLARSAWEQALAIDANRSGARFFLSRLAEDEGLAAHLADRPEEARRAYERALAIDAGNEAAAKALGLPAAGPATGMPGRPGLAQPAAPSPAAPDSPKAVPRGAAKAAASDSAKAARPEGAKAPPADGLDAVSPAPAAPGGTGGAAPPSSPRNPEAGQEKRKKKSSPAKAKKAPPEEAPKNETPAGPPGEPVASPPVAPTTETNP